MQSAGCDMEELPAAISDISTEIKELHDTDPNDSFRDYETMSHGSSLISVDFNFSQLQQELEDISAGEGNHSLNQLEFNNSGQNSVIKRKLAKLLPPLTKAPQSSSRPVTSTDLNQTYPSWHTSSSFSAGSTSTCKQRDYFRSGRYSSPLQKTLKQHELMAKPMFQNYQLLGDSQLVRFSQQVLKARSVDFSGIGQTRRIGYCVSGQKIDDLKYRLLSEECKLTNKVIMMIGTNDFVQRTMFNMMCNSYTDIVNFLKNKVDKIVLLTVPPVAKFQNDLNHWRTVERFNEFVGNFEDRKQVFVVDVAVAFTSYNYKVNNKYFENAFQNSLKVDMVHLNKDGLHLLESNLEALYFRKYWDV